PIRDTLHKRGFRTPLIADIHFTPNAAEIAARIVEKVRVNPGNYADRKQFKTIDYTDKEYQLEIERIRERFLPLVKICKANGTAMRIGTNHGSLSDRIMSRYGDSPRGMVESAMEFLDICESESYGQIVLSMKASNTQVMVEAYRLLVHTMMQRGKIYPLHLGVTEAGEGENGRIKSAIGIGALLLDGIGDTVRVSLTEDPEFEAPVGRKIVDFALSQAAHSKSNGLPERVTAAFSPFEFRRRETIAVGDFGRGEIPKVVGRIGTEINFDKGLAELGYSSNKEDTWIKADHACDYLYFSGEDREFSPTLPMVVSNRVWAVGLGKNVRPFFENLELWNNAAKRHPVLNFVRVNKNDLGKIRSLDLSKVVLVAEPLSKDTTRELRHFILELDALNIKNPVLASLKAAASDESTYQINAASTLGELLIDGLLDGLWVDGGSELAVRTAFTILQASRLRMSKTEYISCPSCGRTQFSLQEVSAKIRNRTEHLKGVKIAIMGCVVNGPGEMADADFGYVGTGPGKISLYKGHEVVMRNLDE
ncbi:MAG: (E)-4-hydroxy-3-methylbut-2-enyl-diphosphate synthase, partial [Spirochaetia bacterium]|nr:(E)-4-hydroxy-3-methylbut-2-enyl-diphosphate synthase [Spirochaetia bacterium]